MTIFPLMAKSDKNLIQLYCKVVAAFSFNITIYTIFDVINNLCDTHKLLYIIKMIPSFNFFLLFKFKYCFLSIKKKNLLKASIVKFL